jgi:trimeric autotransporter adhesin
MPISPLGAPVTIPVTLRVLPPPSIATAPTAMSFTIAPGQPAADTQTLSVASGGTGIDATISATTTSGGTWLFVTPNRGATPVIATVSVNPVGMTAGTYQGAIVISSGTQSITPLAVPVTLTIAQSAPVMNRILNAASYTTGAVSPGEIVTLFGTGMGPVALAGPRFTLQGTLDTTAAGTTVLFDGVAAPVVYTRTDQLSVIVPYSVAGKISTLVQVVYQGQRSVPTAVAVTSTAPGIFTLTADGQGAAAAFNQDGTYNTAANGALPGTLVVLYATGEGASNPAGVDGLLASTVYPKPVAKVSVFIGGVESEVVYAGAAPTLTAGLMQVNARVPAGMPKASTIPVVLKIGDAVSQSGVTIYTK